MPRKDWTPPGVNAPHSPALRRMLGRQSYAAAVSLVSDDPQVMQTYRAIHALIWLLS